MKSKLTYYLHPFIFSLYPALFLYSYNIVHYRENALVIPLLVSLCLAMVSYAISYAIFRKIPLAAIITTSFLFFFFSYGRLRQPLGNVSFNIGGIYLNSDRILYSTIILLLGVITFFAWRNRNKLYLANKILFSLTSALLIFTLVNTAFSELKLGRVSIAKEAETNSNILGSAIYGKPDIYYIILDRYGGDPTIKSYDYDNSQFLNFLKDKGFYIADKSSGNYPKTFMSLDSSLNMGYLDHLTSQTNGGDSSDESIAYPSIQNNKVIKFLKDMGYTYIHVGSSWDANRTNPNADINLIMAGGAYPFPTDEFSTGFINLTAASVILNKMYPDTTAVSKDPLANEHRSRDLYQFSTFTQIPQMAGPKYIFAHILIPHPPYVLDRDCNPINEDEAAKYTEVENYIDQLQCGNKLTEKMINEIIANSKTAPLIIVQGDEGPMPKLHPLPDNLDWAHASNATIKEKFPILNAYYWPGHEDGLYPTITPVNSFRLLFGTYFGADLPLLPDKHYIFDDANHLYKFTDVTDKVNKLLWGK